jgi:alkylhydroperoxidase family enzyme
MPRIAPADVAGNAYERVLAQRPEIFEKWFELDALMRFTGLLDPDLKEEVRRSLAPNVGCVFCASLGEAKRDHPDKKEALAVAYAQLLLEPKSLDDSVFDVLHEEFSDAEIVELTCWTLFMIAAQGFGAAMSIRAATEDEVQVYADWKRDGIAAAAAVT